MQNHNPSARTFWDMIYSSFSYSHDHYPSRQTLSVDYAGAKICEESGTERLRDTHWQSSSQSTMLSGPGRCALPLDWNCRKDLGFSPATWGTASTSFLCSDWSLRNESSSRGDIHPMLPSRVPNNKAYRFVLSGAGVALGLSDEAGSICSRMNFVTWAPMWNSALERSFCPFQLSDTFGA